MKTKTTLALALALALVPLPTIASTWFFARTTLSDGGEIAAASFFEEEAGAISNWSIGLSAGRALSVPYIYSPANSAFIPLGSSRFQLRASGQSETRVADFSFANPIGTGFFNPLAPASREYRLAAGGEAGQYRSLRGGARRQKEVSEPASLLGSAAALGIGMYLKKRRKQNSPCAFLG